MAAKILFIGNKDTAGIKISKQTDSQKMRIKLSINKTPENSQPDHQSWCGVIRSGQVVIIELEPTEKPGGIEVFRPEICLETTYPEMDEGCHVG